MKTMIVTSLFTDPTPVAPPGVGPKIDLVLNWIMFAGITAVIVGIILAGIKMAINNSRGEANEGMKSLGMVILAGILISSASAVAKALI